MANFNKVILLGNLTRDPQLRYLPSQTAVVDFGIACNRRFRTTSGEERDETMFIDCSAFGKAAEIINQYCQKGRPILIEGRLKLDQWEDRQGGGKRSKHTVVVENFQLLGGRGEGATSGNSGAEDGRGGRTPARTSGPSAAPSAPPPEQPFPEEESQFKSDDIPF